MPEDFPFAVEEWDPTETKLIEVVARVRNADVAEATFEAACKAWPNKYLLLCAKALVMRRRKPGE